MQGMSGHVARNTLYLTVASVGQKILAFAYFVVLANILEPERTGAYFLALSITTMFSVITDIGLTPVVIRDVAKRPEEAVQLVQAALGVKLPATLLAMLGAVAAALLLGYDPSLVLLVTLATFVMAADSLSLLYYGVLRGSHVLQYESLGVAIGQGITLLVGGTILYLTPSLPLLVLTLVFGSTFNACFSAWHASRKLGRSILVPVFNKVKAQQLLVTAFPFALAGIFVKTFSYADSLFISKYVGTAAVGVYGVAYKFTYAFQFLPMAFVAALYPAMSHFVVADRAKLSKLLDDAFWYMLLLVTPIVAGLWAVAPQAIALAGEGYEEAVPVLRSLIFVLVPLFLDFPVGSLLNAAGQQALKTKVTGATVIINVVANAILVPRFGLMGAVWSAELSFWFLFLASFAYVVRVLPEYAYRQFLRLVLPFAVSGFLLAFAAHFVLQRSNSLQNPHLGFVVAVITGAAVYGVSIFVTGAFRRQHLEQLRRVISRRSSETYESTASNA